MVVDLKGKSGLGLVLNTDKPEMNFDKDLKSSMPAIRTIEQMQEVLLDKNTRQPRELYYMYRDIYKIADKPVLEKYNLRYDVTAIRPDTLGREFMKTAGHYHPGDFGELYEVVLGRCFCLLQKPNHKNFRNIDEVILVEATAGQKIVIPPGFGHILINPGPDYLVTSNWVSSAFQSEYELYKQAKGAAYFVVNVGEKQQITPGLKVSVEILKNPDCQQVAKLRFVRPASRINRFGLTENNPMYNLIVSNPEALDFLNHPLDYEYNDVFVK